MQSQAYIVAQEPHEAASEQSAKRAATEVHALRVEREHRRGLQRNGLEAERLEHDLERAHAVGVRVERRVGEQQAATCWVNLQDCKCDCVVGGTVAGCQRLH